MEDYLRVGTYVNTHGIKGEIKVYPHTDDITRFSDLDSVLMETKKGFVKYEIAGVRYQKNMVILRFKGINNINDIEREKGADLYITRDQAVPLEEGEYFICDIIGADVITDEGETIGTIKDVLQTGANDVYIVKRPEEKDLLIPVTKECVLDVNPEEYFVKVHLLPGLCDL